ncbi:MAG: cysteine desulfurase [Candidatus Marinimicrobia bacterium]|nr:cysteine desulfurase [Candidatus Neomarinimicrobiota bacterium]
MFYFDHSATTPVDPKVSALMQKVAENHFGNPSSIHQYGQKSRAIIEKSRRQIADALSVKSRNIIFTGGGSEANNMVLQNLLYSDKKHVITSSIEHPAILKVLKHLKNFSVSYTTVPVDKYGLVNPINIASAIQDDTALISIMYANNEVGTIQPIAEIAEIAHKNNILFHSDAIQTPGKIPIIMNELNTDLMSFSAHKFYGPKGVGFLYIRGGIKLHPMIIGGGQEKKLRAGTENTPGIAGLGLAMEMVVKNLTDAQNHLLKLENHFKTRLLKIYPKAIFNGHPELHLPGLVSVIIPSITSDILLVNLDMKGMAVSGGSACSSGTVKPSDVLNAMHMSNQNNISTLRISFGKGNTVEEVDMLIDALAEIITKYNRKR